MPFSEASARFVRQGDEVFCPFHVVSDVNPKQVEAEQPITLTVTIRAKGKVLRPPVRIDLREMPAFTRSFFVEEITDGKKERVDESTWVWSYRLKPRRAGIDEVPRVPFVFYNPDLKPVEKAFQTIWTDPLSITVRPPQLPDPIVDLSSRVLTIATGPVIHASRPGWAGPSVPVLLTVVGVPPIICSIWYLVWRRLYPDAAHRAALRRSRAARHALSQLNRAARQRGRRQAESVVKAVVDYLRNRFDLPIAEPTPDEAAQWLLRYQLGHADVVRQLLAECAAGRFAPEEQSADLIEQARAFILSFEESTCPPSS